MKLQRVICCLAEGLEEGIFLEGGAVLGAEGGSRQEVEPELKRVCSEFLKKRISVSFYQAAFYQKRLEEHKAFSREEELADSLFLTDDLEIVSLAKERGAVCVFCCPSEADGRSADDKRQGEWIAGADLILESLEEIDACFLEEFWNHARGVPCRIAEGERIYLQELTGEDAPALYQIYQRPEVRRFVLEMSGSIEEEIEKLIAYQRTVYRFYGYGIWGIVWKGDGRLIGSCGLEQKEREGHPQIELGYVLNPAFWGEGIAAEAARLALRFAKEHGIKQVWAGIDKENDRSKSVARRIGMTLAGVWQEDGRAYEWYQITI